MAYLDSLLQKTKAEKAAGGAGAAGTSEAQPAEAAPSESPKKERTLVDSYGDVRVYKLPDDPLYFYEVPSPHYRGEEKALISALVDISAEVISIEGRDKFSPDELKKRYTEKVLEIIENTPELKVPIHAKQFYADVVVTEMLGFGLIDPLVRDDKLEDIMVIGPNKPCFVFHRKFDMMRTNIVFYDDKDIRVVIDRIARNIGRRIDVQSPLLDARLPDGTRVNATIPPISLNGSTITLRKFRKDPLTVIDMMTYGTINLDAAAFLWLASDGMGAKPANILIAGGTACGKTTTLNVLCSFVPNSERVLTIEDTAELNLPLFHWIRFETRPPGIEGTGEITMDMLVKNTLRMRPDRIIVGEIRGEEGFTLFTAMNTGHDGSFGTVHANSAQETITRLLSPPISVPEIMIGALTLVVVQHRIHDRRKGVIRRVTEIAEVVSVEGGSKVELQVLFKWNAAKDALEPTGLPCNFFNVLSSYTGLSVNDIQAEVGERRGILKKLLESGVRSMDEVCSVTQNYVLSKRRNF
ncbi:MAG: CpaF family protein [Candidatus Micrarchaeia archaeon]